MHSRFSDSQSPGGTVRIMPHGGAATAMPPALAPVASLAMFELHGIGNPGALIAAHGERPRWYRRGEAIRGSIVLAGIARGHVVLADGTARLRIDLPQRLGGSGEPVPAGLRGLRPEPQPPSGERSGAELTAGASAARAAVPEPATPEEQEAARLGQLPGAAS
ncbi:hypothetical protein [Sphingomonas elodea]|uniref:hypothetical protein n=1 Tax=Sphingomonas elodea TaxID=179878 RepID=UPI0003172798|nr:hypothetical protein [Sphingomonas elodea]